MSQVPLEQTFQEALRHHQAGQFPQAQSLYRQILAQQPHHADALHYLGLLNFQTGQPALDLIHQALALKPHYPQAHSNLAAILRAEGKLDQSIAAARKAIDQDPSLPEAHNNLAIALTDQGQLDQAIAAAHRAIAIKPLNPESYTNLGNALKNKGLLDDAIVAHRQAIALRPSYAQAHTNLGNALKESGELNESIAAHRKALALNPNLFGAHINLGNALREKGQLNDAIVAFRQALALNPNSPDAHTNLAIALKDTGQLNEALVSFSTAARLLPISPQMQANLAIALKETGQLTEAIQAFRRVIAMDPDNPNPYRELAHAFEKQGNFPEAIAAHKAAQARAPASAFGPYDLAALGIGDLPPSTPQQYLIDFFNDYSTAFDHHLVHRLNYQGPQLLFDAVTAAAPKTPLNILDLGCGTGLCGVLFRPLARHLTGIDVAPKMIQKSRQRNVYDQLLQQDIASALQQFPPSFDLILAADVFIYVGRLDEIFASVARALRPGGLFAFTIESTETADYILRRSRRYAQSLPYIRRLASQNHFTEVSIHPATLRKSADPEYGQVIVLRATPS